jgi:hypothetical protein
MLGWANSGGCAAHSTWINARDPARVPYEHQFICGGNGETESDQAKNNEITCHRLDTSLEVLIMAPAMTSMAASGGNQNYYKYPKPAVDVTGDYILWSGNMGTDRLHLCGSCALEPARR